MSASQADSKRRFPVRTMCRVLGVSSSGYHDWLARRPSARQTANARLAEQIRQVHQASDGTYGMPRVRAQLGPVLDGDAKAAAIGKMCHGYLR